MQFKLKITKKLKKNNKKKIKLLKSISYFYNNWKRRKNEAVFAAKFAVIITLIFREDKGDQLLDYKHEIQTMEEQLKKLQKEVNAQWMYTQFCSFFCSPLWTLLKKTPHYK